MIDWLIDHPRQGLAYFYLANALCLALGYFVSEAIFLPFTICLLLTSIPFQVEMWKDSLWPDR